MESGTEGTSSPETKRSGHEYHVLSEQQREGGNFEKAIESAARASLLYLDEGNIEKALRQELLSFFPIDICGYKREMRCIKEMPKQLLRNP